MRSPGFYGVNRIIDVLCPGHILLHYKKYLLCKRREAFRFGTRHNRRGIQNDVIHFSGQQYKHCLHSAAQKKLDCAAHRPCRKQIHSVFFDQSGSTSPLYPSVKLRSWRSLERESPISSLMAGAVVSQSIKITFFAFLCKRERKICCNSRFSLTFDEACNQQRFAAAFCHPVLYACTQFL